MVVQLADKYRYSTRWPVCTRLVLPFFVLMLFLAGIAHGGELRRELQRSYDLYKQSELHYKVFALKHEGDSWDGWYTWGYNDLDEAILDAVRECSKGSNVSGKCQVYGLGNEVVVGLDPLQLQGKIEQYRISGMVNRSYPKPADSKLRPLGFSGDGHYFAGVFPEKTGKRVFIYDTNDELWKHTFLLDTDLSLLPGRSFSLSHDGKSYAYGSYTKSSTDKGKSAIVIKGWGEKSQRIPLANGAFWNGGCGMSLSPNNREVAVCVDDGITTRILRYEIGTGKKLGEFNSSRMKGKFDKSIAYSPDGNFILVLGGRYQFDWVLKKKGKEAEMAWLFSIAASGLENSLEFPLGPGRKGPESIGFTSTGHDLLVVTTGGIVLHTADGKKSFLHSSQEGTRVLLSPHGVLAVADGLDLSRYKIVGNELVLIDSEQVATRSTMLGFDFKADRLILVGEQEMTSLAAFRQGDLQSLALYKEAGMMFGKGKYKDGAALLAKIIASNPKLPSSFSTYSFYRKFPNVPLAYWGDLYASSVETILTASPKVSRLGFGYVKDPQSGLFFTTVKRVDAGTSVSRSPIEVGDRITHINGTPVVLSSQVAELLEPLPTGTRVDVTYMRNGRIARTSLVTEEGFQDTGKAARVLLSLFDYGQLAAQAGHPGLCRMAAVRLREISARYPSSFRTDLVEKVAVSLEALAFSVEGNMDTAFDVLAQSAPHPFQFRLFNPLVWGYFYKDRQHLAEVIGVPVDKLPQFDGVMQSTTQDYPDLHGRLIPAVTPPPLLR